MANKIKNLFNFLLFFIQTTSPFIFLVLFNISFICNKNFVFFFSLSSLVFGFISIISAIAVKRRIDKLSKKDIRTILEEKHGKKFLTITSLATFFSFFIASFTVFMLKLYPNNYLLYIIIILSWVFLIISLRLGPREQFLILKKAKREEDIKYHK